MSTRNSRRISRRGLIAGAAVLGAHSALAQRITPQIGGGINQFDGALGGAGSVASGFAGLKSKLLLGQNAKILFIPDSKGYTANSPPFLMAAALGALFPAITVNLYQWGEWLVTDTVTGSGPKTYNAPITITTGSGGGVLSIYNATLPGSVISAMFDGSRKPAAIDAVGAPDVVLWYNGANMDSVANVQNARGLYFGAIGMMELEYPGVPQIIIAENPNRDDNAMALINGAITDVVTAHPGLGYIDGYTPFINVGKASQYYRAGGAGNVHPSDSAGAGNFQGAQLTTNAIMAAFNASGTKGLILPSWPKLSSKTNLCPNGDFSAWSGAAPTGWGNNSGSTQTKETTIKYGSASYSNAILGTGINSQVKNFLFGGTQNAFQGQIISVAALAYSPSAALDAFSFIFVCNSTTYQMNTLVTARDGWMWYVSSGIQCDASMPDFGSYFRIDPNFNDASPNTTPQYVQKVIAVQGALPMGGLA